MLGKRCQRPMPGSPSRWCRWSRLYRRISICGLLRPSRCCTTGRHKVWLVVRIKTQPPSMSFGHGATETWRIGWMVPVSILWNSTSTTTSIATQTTADASPITARVTLLKTGTEWTLGTGSAPFVPEANIPAEVWMWPGTINTIQPFNKKPGYRLGDSVHQRSRDTNGEWLCLSSGCLDLPVCGS